MTLIVHGLRRLKVLPKDMKILIFNTFVVAFGSFMITPFLAVFLKNTAGLDTGRASLLVALATFIQFGGSVIGGVIGERLGLKTTMVVSLIIRVVGLMLLSAAPGFPALLVPAILLVAAAPALYLPSNRAYAVSTVTSELRPLFVSLSNAALNAGMAAGPLIAALFIDTNHVALFMAVAALFALLALSHQLTLEPKVVSGARQPALRTLAHSIRRVWKTMIVNTAIFYVYFFFQNFMGLYVSKVSNMRVFSFCMLLNFTLMFLLQPPLSGLIARIDYRRLIVFGFALMGSGLAIMATGTVPALFAGTAIMTLGQLALFLRGDLEMIEKLPSTPAIAFGLQRLATGFGGLICGLVGGPVFELFENWRALNWFWIAIAIQCLAFAAAAWIVLRPRTIADRAIGLAS